MMKYFLRLLVIVCLLAMPLVSYADVISGNLFQQKNKESMQKIDRTRFCANGPNGYIVLKDEPGSDAPVGDDVSFSRRSDRQAYYNGEELPIDCTYICDGEYWGVVTPNHYIWYPGWVRMDQLLAVYTGLDFEKANKADFYEYTGGYDAVFAAEKLIFWAWPGSDREKRIVQEKDDTLQSVTTQYAFRDNEGREWGYVRLNYDASYIHREGWICLSDPANQDIPSFYPSPMPAKWSPDGNMEWEHTAPDETPSYSLANFNKVKIYEQGETFSDVEEYDWYNNAIASVYEYDIMESREEHTFAPDAQLTYAQTFEIAARLHAYYKYGRTEGNRLLNAYTYTYARGGPSAGYPNGLIEYCNK